MKFWEENGKGNGRRSTGSGHGAALLENPESHLRWYFKYFLGTAHQNYYGKTTSKDLFILSIVKSDEDYRAILWAKSGLQRLYLPMSHKPRTPHSICQEFGDIDIVRAPKEIKQADIQKDLLYIEEQEGAINFKFGVLYRRHGQCTDDEILGNNGITPAFQRFLDLIGEKVALKGFNEYRGGLDVKGDTTGTHSYRTIMEGKHIMFHVANLLPFTKDNPQQVERKRHIGNDIVNIVFQEDYDDFDPTCFKSHMSHIYALVTYQHTTDSYLLRVYNESSVPRYGPEISVEYTDIDHFRHVLLVKLMNGEKAVYATPQFVARRERTIQQLLKEIYNRYVRSNEDFDHLRPIADKIMDTTPRIGRKKRIRKAAKFQAKGQDLKVQKIISGHAPTSKTCTSDTLQRKFEHYSTWHYDRIVRDFHQRIICADFWDTYIILGTDSGLSLINTSCADESGIAEIYDHNMFVPKQISVIEEKSVVVVRAEKGKHKTGYVYIFDLSALTMKSHCTKNFKRKTKQERLHGTKGCTNLCANVSKMSGDLHMAVVKHKIIQLYEWNKIPAQGQGWFTLKRDFQVCDVQSLCMFNRPSGLKICAGTSTEFLIIDTEAPEDDKTKCIERLQTHKENSSICITPVIKEDINNWAIGVLLTYNNISLLEQFAFTLHPDNIFSLLIKWNVKPVHIHSSLPYLIAIGQQGIEMRMASNGNVVHSIDVASVSYLSQRCQHIYLSTWDHVTCLSEIISLPTTTVSLYSSSSTISSAGLGGLSNDSFDDEDEHSESDLSSTLTRECSPLRRSFHDHSRSRLFSESSTEFTDSIFSCLSMTDLSSRPL